MTGATRAGLDLMHGELTREIIGAFYDVYNTLGYGFAESVYQHALPIELAKRGLKSERELPLTVRYDHKVVGVFRADLIVEEKVIVESKVAEKIVHVHEMQLLNYLKATGINVGLILNFGPQPTFRRMFLSSPQEGSILIRA
ncbi:MAG: GxxExxY protein [Gemmatimonadales bacterium]